MRHLPLTTRVLLALTAVVAVGTSVAALAAPARSEGGTAAWVLLFVAAAWSEGLRVNSDDDGGHTIDFTFSGAVLVAAAVLYGPLPAGLIALAALGLVDLLRGAPVLKLAFNAVVYAVAGALASLAFAWGGGAYGVVDQAAIPALMLLVAVHACVTTVLVGAVTGSVQGLSAARGILLDARTLPPKVMEYSLGLILALQVAVAPAFTPLLIPLLFAVYRQHARSEALARETQTALRHLADIVDARDASTFEHSERVGLLVERLATALRLPERRIRTLARAGRLHDLGKIVVDTAVLRKPGKLDDGEFDQLRAHPAVSARLLAPFGFAAEESRLIELHHERFDGGGYYHVAQQDLPLEAHFLILADAWDAMTSDRPYRKALSDEDAAQRIRADLGTQFHPHLGQAFIAVMEGRDPAEDVDPAQLRALRQVLGRPTARVDLSRVRRAVDAARGREVRLLTAAAIVATAIAGLGSRLTVPLLGIAVLAATTAAWRHAAERAGIRRTLAALADSRLPADLPSAVGAVDAAYPLLWAGVLQADDRGRLRPLRTWTSAAAPATTATLVDGALRRLGRQPANDGAPRPVVNGRPLTLVRQEHGWTALIAARRPLPDAVLQALSSSPAMDAARTSGLRSVPSPAARAALEAVA
jgi:hypothetical protein